MTADRGGGGRGTGGPDAGGRREPAAAGPAVIDASVGLKWVLPEPGSAAAVSLRGRLVEAGAPVYVPDLFWLEAGNALWRRTRGAEPVLSAEEARELLEALRLAPLRSEPSGPVSGRALEIALATGATVYDAAYVALSELRGARFWMADARLAGQLGGTEWEGRVAVLQ